MHEAATSLNSMSLFSLIVFYCQNVTIQVSYSEYHSDPTNINRGNFGECISSSMHMHCIIE